jgi:hypothetical protein
LLILFVVVVNIYFGLSPTFFQIDDATKMYEASEPFPFLHCWKILKDEQKWNERVLDHSTTGTAADASQASGVPLEVHSNSGINVDDRLEGCDSVKRRAKRGCRVIIQHDN